MQLRRVRADKAQVDRYITELWIPYNRELGEIIETERLSNTYDLENEVEWQVEKFEEATDFGSRLMTSRSRLRRLRRLRQPLQAS